MKYSYYIDKDFGYVYTIQEPVSRMIYGKMVVIPKGYRSDGISVPRFCWPLVSPRFREKTLESSWFHDRLYDTHLFTRKMTDQWYRDDLIRHGIMRVVAWVVYLMLRCFGFLHW